MSTQQGSGGSALPIRYHRKPLLDLAIGFLIPYAVAAAILLVFMSDLEAEKVIFSFVLPLLTLSFPFFALGSNPFGITFILALPVAFFASFRFAPPTYRPYAIGLTFVAWWAYGIYCSQWVTA